MTYDCNVELADTTVENGAGFLGRLQVAPSQQAGGCNQMD